MKIFIDDTRDPQDVFPGEKDWTLIQNYSDLEKLLATGVIPEKVSFDYFLDVTDREHNGRDCAALLVRTLMNKDVFPICYVHTSSKSKSELIKSILSSWYRRKDLWEDAETKIIIITKEHES